MEKRGLFIILLVLLTLKFSLAASIIPTSNSGNLIADTLRPLGLANPGQIYEEFGYLIDFVLFLIIFIPLCKKFLSSSGPKIDDKAATGLGILIAFGVSFFEWQRGIRIGALGPVWGIVLLLIFAALAFSIFRGQEKKNFTGFMAAYILTYIVSVFWLSDADRQALGFIWGWFQLIAIAFIIIGIIKLIGAAMKFVKGSEDIGEFSEGTGKMLGYGLGAAGAAGKGLGKAAGGLWKGGKWAKKKGAAWRDAQKLKQIDEESKKLDTLINNVDDQLRALNVAELKNARERMELLTNIRALASIRSEIIIKFRSKNPEVLARGQELNEKFKQASSRLDELIKRFYSGLSIERQRILDETRLNASEIKFLDAALQQEINTTKKIFNELKAEVDYIVKTTNNHDIQSRFNDILKMRNNMRATILNVIELIKGNRSKNIKMLKQLNDEDIRLAENLKKALLSNPDSVFQYIDSMMQNLGREITLMNSDSLKNNEISRLRRELKTYYDAISSLDAEVTEYIQKLNVSP